MRRRGILRISEALDFRTGQRRRRFSALRAPRSSNFHARPGSTVLRCRGRMLYAARRRASATSARTQQLGGASAEASPDRHVRRVTAEECGSELDAALCEAETIRRSKPPYNRLGKHLPRIAFVRLDAADPFPRLLVTARLGAARTRLLGPFHGRESARETLAVLARPFRSALRGPLRPDPGAAGCFQGHIGDCSLPAALPPIAKYGARSSASSPSSTGDGGARRSSSGAARHGGRSALRARGAPPIRFARQLERRSAPSLALEFAATASAPPDLRGGAALVYVAVHGVCRAAPRRRRRDSPPSRAGGRAAGVAPTRGRCRDRRCDGHPRGVMRSRGGARLLFPLAARNGRRAAARVRFPRSYGDRFGADARY